MLLLGSSGIGWIPVAEQKDVGMLLMSFVFPLELVATIVAFLARDTLGATTLGLAAVTARAPRVGRGRPGYERSTRLARCRRVASSVRLRSDSAAARTPAALRNCST